MSADEGVPRWLWRLATFGLAAAAMGVMALAAALYLGAADPPRAGPLVWQDDFKSGAERWSFFAPDGGRLAPRDGALWVELTGPNQTAYALTPAPAGDFTLEVAGAPVAGEPGAAYGLVFGWQDETHHNAVLVNGNGYAEAYHGAGGGRQYWYKWQQWPHILVSPESNRIRVDVRGDSLSVRINDELLVEAAYRRGARGQIGVVARGPAHGAQAGADAVGAQVVFSWVRVWAAGP